MKSQKVRNSQKFTWSVLWREMGRGERGERGEGGEI